MSAIAAATLNESAFGALVAARGISQKKRKRISAADCGRVTVRKRYRRFR
jgi:hypothetical protein